MTYVYSGVVQQIHDGDTLTINVDLGFSTWHLSPFRLLGCNARELSEPGGLEARANLVALLPPEQQVSIRSVKPDKFGGRYLAMVWLPDGTDVVAKLIAENWLATWNGTGIKLVPPWPRP